MVYTGIRFSKVWNYHERAGAVMAVREKFRATLEYDPELDRYYVSLKFYGGRTPEEIHAYQKAREVLMAKKK